MGSNLRLRNRMSVHYPLRHDGGVGIVSWELYYKWGRSDANFEYLLW